jgi:hypothetical protein
VADISTEGMIFAGISLLTVCLLTQMVWRQRHRYQGIDMVVVPLAFGGLGVVIGQAWVGSLHDDSSTAVHGAPLDMMHGLLIMTTMLTLCLPACVFLCSHSSCGGRRRSIILELAVLHLMMMVGMFTVSWIVMQSHASKPGPIWSYLGGLLGMVSGATVAILALRAHMRRRPQHQRVL